MNPQTEAQRRIEKDDRRNRQNEPHYGASESPENAEHPAPDSDERGK
jgi:hypothetical protein